MEARMLSPKNVGGPIDGFAIWLAQKFNGTKTVTGVFLIVSGLCTVFFTPDYKEGGLALIVTGFNMFIMGVTHKLLKSEQRNE